MARRLIRMPLLNTIGIRTKKVDRFTFIGSLIAEAGTKVPLSLGSVVGRSMSMLKGCSPAAEAVDDAIGML